jgi:hypothetical protein
MDFFTRLIPTFILLKGPMTLGQEARGLTFSGSRPMHSGLDLISRQRVNGATASQLNEISAREESLPVLIAKPEKTASTLEGASFV